MCFCIYGMLLLDGIHYTPCIETIGNKSKFMILDAGFNAEITTIFRCEFTIPDLEKHKSLHDSRAGFPSNYTNMLLRFCTTEICTGLFYLSNDSEAECESQGFWLVYI